MSTNRARKHNSTPKYRYAVILGWTAPNAPKRAICVNQDQVDYYTSKWGSPDHIDRFRHNTTRTGTPAHALVTTGTIPAAQGPSTAMGLFSVKSDETAENVAMLGNQVVGGRTAQPMSFVHGKQRTGAFPIPADSPDMPGLIGLKRHTWQPMSYLTWEAQMGSMGHVASDRRSSVAPAPFGASVRKAVETATHAASRDTVRIVDETGTKRTMRANLFVVDETGQITASYNGSHLRAGKPQTYKDGTPKPKPGTYLIYGEMGKNQPRVTQEHLNRFTEDELLEVRRITMKVCRSRDLQRSTKRSDIGGKRDGADMQDAMQDSVLYLAKAGIWAESLPEAAYSVETRTCNAWQYVPARFRKEAAEADELDEPYNLDEKVVIVTKQSLIGQAVRNAVMAHFTIPDRRLRTITAKFLKRDFIDETDTSGQTPTREVEYTQTVDNGAPGYTLLFSESFEPNYNNSDNSEQRVANPTGSGWKVARGSKARKPQHVGIAALRTAGDNPYNAARFAAAWGDGSEYPILREVLEIGGNAGDLGRTAIFERIATSRANGTKVNWRHIKDIKAQAAAEWDKLRDLLEVTAELTDATNDVEADAIHKSGRIGATAD